MSRPETDQRDLFDIDETELEAMLQRLQQDFAARDFSELDPDAATILSTMPGKLREYVAALQQVKKQKEEIKTEKNPRKKEEKRKEVEVKLAKLASETFTAACASTLPVSEALKFHQKCKLDVRALNEFGETGLNPLAAAMAAGKGRADIAQLLDAGADVNFKSPQNSNSAHFAVMFNADPEVMRLLIERGVDVNLVNNFGFTPRDMAVMKGRGELAQILKEAGAKLNRALPPKASMEEEEAGKKDKKDVGRDKKEEEKADKEKEVLARKKKQEELKKELEEKKQELAEAKALLAQRQMAESRLALDLAEESKKLGEKLAQKKAERIGLDFSFSAAKADEGKSAARAVTVEIPKPPEVAPVKDVEVAPKFELKVEKEPNFVQRIAEKIFGKEAAAKVGRMNLDDLLLFAVQCGARAETLFLVDCGANPNRPEILQAALGRGGSGGSDIVICRAQVAMVQAAASSLGAGVREAALKIVNDVLKVVEHPLDVAPTHRDSTHMPTRTSSELRHVSAEKAMPEVAKAMTPVTVALPAIPVFAPRVVEAAMDKKSMENPSRTSAEVPALRIPEETLEMAVERPSSRPSGPFQVSQTKQQHIAAKAA